MNKVKRIEDRELIRNGEGYYDPTAYEAIKRADAELEGKKNSKKKKKAPIQRQYHREEPYDYFKAKTIPQYRKWKLGVLDDLGIELTEDERAHLNALETEYEIDAYAHTLIMRKD